MVAFVYPTAETKGVIVEKSPVDILRIFKVAGQVVTDYILKKAEEEEGEVSWLDIKELLKEHFDDFSDYMVALDFAYNLVKDWRSAL